LGLLSESLPVLSLNRIVFVRTAAAAAQGFSFQLQ